jgi:type II secretory pathway pseudopilin PulG
MGAIIAAIMGLMSGIAAPIKQWLDNKAQVAKAEQDYKLALLQAQTQQVTAAIQADSSDTANMLSATTAQFKQGTWYFFSAIIIFSIVCPTRAHDMWANLTIVPDWFRNLYVAMTLVVWGINPVKNGAMWIKDSVTDVLSDRRDFKLAKATINQKALADALRIKLFPNGMTNDQWTAAESAVQTALDASIQGVQ